MSSTKNKNQVLPRGELVLGNLNNKQPCFGTCPIPPHPPTPDSNQQRPQARGSPLVGRRQAERVKDKNERNSSQNKEIFLTGGGGRGGGGGKGHLVRGSSWV